MENGKSQPTHRSPLLTTTILTLSASTMLFGACANQAPPPVTLARTVIKVTKKIEDHQAAEAAEPTPTPIATTP